MSGYCLVKETCEYTGWFRAEGRDKVSQITILYKRGELKSISEYHTCKSQEGESETTVCTSRTSDFLG